MELNTEDQTIPHAQEHHQHHVTDNRKIKGIGGINNKISTLLKRYPLESLLQDSI
jgi:hypothetical protein